MTSIKLTADDVRNCSWTLVEVTPTFRRWIGRGDHPKTGLPITVQKTEFIADEDVQELNRAERDARDAKPWSAGAGSEKGGNVPMIRVARIPINKLFADGIAEKLSQGDDDHLKWWLGRDENQPFRTKSGRL